MTEVARIAAGAGIRTMLQRSAIIVPVARRHFTAATALLDRSMLSLRGSDALHLAIAADNDATVCTLDRRMAEAGQALGVAVSLVE